MTLEEQVAQITNPQEFTRLCNTVFSHKYGNEFQVIDGTRSDGGNDGYIISEKRIIAIYCPIKPERKRDIDYLNKIKSDMLKAVSLRDSESYEIENWTFVTPRKLSNKNIIEMRKFSKDNGFNAVHLDSTFLATELTKNKHLIDEFPSLHYLDLNKKIDKLMELLKSNEVDIKEYEAETELANEHIYKGETKNSEEMEQVLSIRKNRRNENTKSDLRTIIYKTKDISVKLNALLGLFDYYDPIEDSTDDMIQLADSGILIASSIPESSVKSYFLAQKGYMLSYKYTQLDMETTFQIKADNAIGFQTITEEYRNKVIERLHGLEKDYKDAFSEAFDIAQKNNDYYLLASVLLSIGNAAGQRALYLQTLNVNDRAATEKAICKRALLTAKEIYDAYDDEHSSAYATCNLANEIRNFGEEKEATNLVKDVIETADKYEDHMLKQKAKWLLETLESGVVPDYVGGERRKWDE